MYMENSLLTNTEFSYHTSSWCCLRYAKEGADRTRGRDITGYLSLTLGLPEIEIRQGLHRHPYWCHIPLHSVQDTLHYLLELGYTRDQVWSNVHLLVYPRQDCKTCLQKLCAKLLERSPLKYKLTKAISFLDPTVAVLKSTRSERLKSTLEIVLANNWITGVAADLVDRQYKDSLEQKMKDKQNGEKQEGDRKRAAKLQKELQAKKQNILSEAQKQADILQEEIESLKKK
uniref:Uncharacterized protein n=1 Tax=Timema monikensis TaxID=170555 RepID=A0A7R9HSR9_9NEOP|nr:unnamed protein product [Timema monikensis]